jgi:nucleoside 2-deoxyribosyltransferase
MKELLFISYANDNYDKVKLIKKELADHLLFEALVVADRRKPNKALVKLITEGIDSAYCIIPILSPQSYGQQWINQEIGYAFGQNKPIIPIVENSILNDLKGFVHKQNQCPYNYTLRTSLFKSSENIGFMEAFKVLIKDLEDEYKAFKKKSTLELVREANSSFLQPNEPFLSNLRKPTGTIARTGEICPESGMWKTRKDPPTSTMPFTKGVKMPHYEGRAIIWKLVSYA